MLPFFNIGNIPVNIPEQKKKLGFIGGLKKIFNTIFVVPIYVIKNAITGGKHSQEPETKEILEKMSTNIKAVPKMIVDTAMKIIKTPLIWIVVIAIIILFSYMFFKKKLKV